MKTGGCYGSQEARSPPLVTHGDAEASSDAPWRRPEFSNREIVSKIMRNQPRKLLSSDRNGIRKTGISDAI